MKKKLGVLCVLLCVNAACRHSSTHEQKQHNPQSETATTTAVAAHTQQDTLVEVTERIPDSKNVYRPFIFSIDVQFGTSIEIITGDGEFDYDVDWNNDGTYDETRLTGSVTHDYGAVGPQTIRIRGQFPHMRARGDKGFNLCGMKVLQWGDIQWHSMKSMFEYCRSLSPTFPSSNAPDLSHVTDMSGMFHEANAFNQPLDHWEVRYIERMDHMFHGANAFNQPLSSWNTSNVTDMTEMFNGATSFNQPPGQWDVANVKSMRWMFTNATLFNQPLDQWDVSNVTDMAGMFSGAKDFNQPLNSWNTHNVTDMAGMFWAASTFNQPLDHWDVSHVTNMSDMFHHATAFNQPLNSWDTKNVNEMGDMFHHATAFNQPLDQWNVRNLKIDRPELNGFGRLGVHLMDDMLSHCQMNTANYDATLTAWAKQLPMPPRQFGAKGLTYCKASKARQKLIDAGWTIEGDSKKCK